MARPPRQKLRFACFFATNLRPSILPLFSHGSALFLMRVEYPLVIYAFLFIAVFHFFESEAFDGHKLHYKDEKESFLGGSSLGKLRI
jgi:hypothetical protein